MDHKDQLTEILGWASGLAGPTAYAAILGILLVCGLGVPIPEDITLFVAGFLASGKHITLPGALLVGFIGVMAGDSFLFFMGRRFGGRVFLLPVFNRIFTADRIKAAEDRVQRNGHFICFIARFLPGLRSPIFAMAGAMGVRPIVFLSQDGLAALISVPVWIYVGYWFGENLDEALARLEQLQFIVLIAVAAAVAVYVLYRFWKRGRTARKESEGL